MANETLSVKTFSMIEPFLSHADPCISHFHRDFQIGGKFASVIEENRKIESSVSLLSKTQTPFRDRFVQNMVILDNGMYFDTWQIALATEYPVQFNGFPGMYFNDDPIRAKILSALEPAVRRVRIAVLNHDKNTVWIRYGGLWIDPQFTIDWELEILNPEEVEWIVFNAYWGYTNSLEPIFYFAARLGSYEDGGFAVPVLLEDVLQLGMVAPLVSIHLGQNPEHQIVDLRTSDPYEYGALERGGCGPCFRS